MVDWWVSGGQPGGEVLPPCLLGVTNLALGKLFCIGVGLFDLAESRDAGKISRVFDPG